MKYWIVSFLALWALGAIHTWTAIILPAAGSKITTARRLWLTLAVAMLWPLDAIWHICLTVNGAIFRLYSAAVNGPHGRV